LQAELAASGVDIGAQAEIRGGSLPDDRPAAVSDEADVDGALASAQPPGEAEAAAAVGRA